MRRSVTITESATHAVSIDPDEAEALRQLGKTMAVQQAFWGDQQDEPEAERSIISCRRRDDDRYDLRVADAVGAVAAGDLQIIVRPKIDMEHFFHLTARSRAVHRVDQKLVDLDSGDRLWELICHWYISELEISLDRGLRHQYDEVTDTLREVRGRILTAPTARDFAAARIRVHCQFDEFTIDSPMNRVFKRSALEVARSDLLSRELRRRARRALGQMASIGDLRGGDGRISPGELDRPYLHTFRLAKDVLAGSGRTLQDGTQAAHGFLFKTPPMIEEGIRQILNSSSAIHQQVRKGRRRLGASRLTLNPDLLVEGLWTGDVKYKLTTGDWVRDDLYQAVAFASGFGVPRALIVGFTNQAHPQRQVDVGPIAVRNTFWKASEGTSPEEAQAALCDDVAEFTQG